MPVPSGVSTTGLFAGRYAIERVLGQGASAVVHLARDTQSGKSVALKILRPELVESRASGRFLKEIRRTAGLQHPHILPVLDSGAADGRLYFALPYMEGGTLRHLLRREKTLELTRVVEIARTIAEALDYAHQRGLVHRDVKPENILFTHGQAVLGDFGIARALDISTGDTSTTSTTVRGTPAYMSPEQAAGSATLDARSDLYSLACVIYEMITGMAAFIGPTPESVIAQRFAVLPRNVRVYRPTVPVAVDDCLSIAFAVTPSDRYPSCTSMVNALERSLNASGTVVSHEPGRVPRRALVAGGVLIVLAGSAVLGWNAWAGPRAPDVGANLDTTRIVLLPLQRDSVAAAPWREDDLLLQALARWRGITLVDHFQVADAVRRQGAVRSADDATAIARGLDAGRYIRGRVTALEGGWRVSASLFDAANGEPLYQATAAVPARLADARVVFARLADSLLLRGLVAEAVPLGPAGSRSLPAIQAFTVGQGALDEWDLAVADSAFQTATTFDPSFGRAHLWLAQSRAWQEHSAIRWRSIAQRAAVLSDQLTERERRLARALVHLANASYDAACQEYQALIQRDSRDFAAWYGRGQCESMDNRVVADARSPSGWRFLMSAETAMRAYARAFEVLPSVHRGYDRGAFERLRVVLMVAEQLTSGYSLPDSGLFWGRLGLINDTLALIPYPWRQMAASEPPLPPGADEARLRRRREYHRIAQGWSVAFPASPGAKRAVALALELLGDPTAVDTLRVARRLATDQTRRTELAAEEITMLVKFGLPARMDRLNLARRLADSLLTSVRDVTPQESRALVSTAALFGRCADVDRLARQAAPLMPRSSTSAHLYLEAQVHLIHATLGCRIAAPVLDVRQLAALLDAERQRRTAAASAHFDVQLLYRPALLALDSSILERVRRSTDALVIAAALSAARGDTERARATLDSSDSRSPSKLSPDIGLAKARLWLALGDTARATRFVDRMLDGIAELDFRMARDPEMAASLGAAIGLRAELALARRDDAATRQWGGIAVTFFSAADGPLRVVAHRARDATAR